MNPYIKKIKPSIRSIKAYHLQEHKYRIKLNQNESPYDIPAWLKKEILDEFAAQPWNRYPEFVSSGLSSGLSEFLKLKPEQLIIGNGSNELLQTLFSVVLSKGKKLLIVAPTFSIYYQLAHVAEAEIIEIEFNDDWSFPVEKIIRTLQTQPIDLCIICSPNSPTGVELQQKDLQQIVKSAGTLILLDEAYHEFSDSNNLSLLAKNENLIITRTFSKAMGLAGLRVGYMVGEPDLIEEINKGKLPYNLNLFSELTASKLLQNADLLTENIRKIKSEKQRVISACQALPGVRVYPSNANFFMMKTPLSATEIFENFLEKGILIRNVSGYHANLKSVVRVSIGTPEDNDEFLAELKNISTEWTNNSAK